MHPRNTFSERSADYARSRPLYPAALYAWLAELCPQRRCVWDCACGNGQAAVGLSPYFERVVATDVSAEQIESHLEGDNIQYSVAPAEQSGLPDRSVDLILVAQALHWFDYDRFWPEVKRVAGERAVFCAWGYDWFTISPKIDETFIAPLRSALEPFWNPRNQILWRGYQPAEIKFPFEPIAAPRFEIEMTWSAEQLVGYLQTWSAYKLSQEQARSKESVNSLLDTFCNRFTGRGKLHVVMPMKILAGAVG